MRISKSISGFTEVNTRTQEFFELKVVAPAHESERIAKCRKEVEDLVRRIDSEFDEKQKGGSD